MFEKIRTFFGTDDFMPHGMCYLWHPGVLGLHLASDALITAAYFSIPFTLVHFLRRRKDLEFNSMIGCFALFIVACGTTHLLAIVTVWHPIYWVSGAVKAITAAASVPTAILLAQMMPTALRWPSPRALRDANQQLLLANTTLLAQAAEQERMERELQRINRELQDQLGDMRRLHELSTRLIQTTELPQVLDEILAATVALQRADFGMLQLFDNKTQALRIVAQRGFSQCVLDRFDIVTADGHMAASRALRQRERVIIEDVQKDPAYEPLREIAREGGYRGIQAAPIIGRDGQIKGMLSTHFSQPHRPPDSDLQLTDLYMRLAADLLERVQNEQELRAARDEANRANRAKSRFLATASHDLRQPVHALSLLNGTLRRLPLGEDATEAVVAQEQAVNAMAGLLSALLDISKLEAGAIKPDIQDFALSCVLKPIQAEFSELARAKGLRLELCNASAAARSDPTLLGQILRNLLSNAIRYTPRGSVCIRCVEEPGKIRIEVEDSGIGIAEEHLPNIFDEFYQVKEERGAREGHGLGLNIVQRVAALLDHELEVHSVVGRGTTFSVSVPTGVVPTATAASRKTHILVVDDDPAMLVAARLLLKAEGFRVSSAAGLAEAVRLAREHDDIEVIISDYHLGKGELGTQVIDAVREIRGAALSAVILSADTSRAVIDSIAKVHAGIAIASKPLKADELLGLLARG
jgi:two-component system, sensor histidine kinase